MFDLKNKLNFNLILLSNTDATPIKKNQHFDLKTKDISKNLLLLLDLFLKCNFKTTFVNNVVLPTHARQSHM
jgi:hypothetical protein